MNDYFRFDVRILTEFLINFESQSRTLSQSVEQLELINKFSVPEYERMFAEIGHLKVRLHLIDMDFREIAKSLEGTIDVYWQAENNIVNLVRRLPIEFSSRDTDLTKINVSRISSDEHIVDNWLNQLLWNEEDENS
jgi:hypothetical protein